MLKIAPDGKSTLMGKISSLPDLADLKSLDHPYNTITVAEL